MNERVKILHLLQDGKITAEQAELLLSALDDTNKQQTNNTFPQWKRQAQEWKTFGSALSSQISSAVSQTIGEMKRGLESQLDLWSFGDTISEHLEEELPETVTSLSIETVTAKIHVVHWDRPFVRIYVRAEIHTDDPAKSKQILSDALQVTRTEDHYRLRILQNGGKNAVNSASVDVFLPKSAKSISLRNRNGGVQADSLSIVELRADTANGNLFVSNSDIQHLHLSTNNGRIDILNSVSHKVCNVYATSKNGNVLVDGIGPETNCTGSAKTSLGRVECNVPGLLIRFSDERRKNSATFETPELANSSETRLQIETKNGKITIKS